MSTPCRSPHLAQTLYPTHQSKKCELVGDARASKDLLADVCNVQQVRILETILVQGQRGVESAEAKQ